MKMAKWIKEAAVAAAVIGAGIGGGMATAEAADVAQIGTVGYETIAEALSAAGSGDTITLLADIELASTVTLDKDVTIDLNGNDIGATGCRALWIKAGTVEITGAGTVSANGEGLDETGSVIRVGDGAANEAAAKLTVGEDVTVSSSKSYGITTFGKNSGGIALDVYGTVAVTSGGGADAAISGNGNGGLSAVDITIRDGAVVSATNGAAIFFPGAGTLVIEGGDVTGPTAVYAKSGSVTVSGGTLRGTGAAAAYQYKPDGLAATGDALVIDTCGYPNGNPAATVTGGTLVSANGKAVASYAKDETYTALEDIIPATSAALFGDAESDGVPAGYALVAVAGTDPVLYAVSAMPAIQYFNTWSVPNVFYFDDEDPIPARTTQGTVPTIKRVGDTAYHAAEEWVEISWTVTASTATNASTPDDTIAMVDADGLVTFTQPGTVKVWLTMTDPSGAAKSSSKTVKYDLPPAYVVSADGQTKTAYGSLYGAFNAAQDGETVVLGKDGTGNNLAKMTLDADKAIALDLNGHTFTFSANYRADGFGAFITVQKGLLTVVDTGETKGGIVVSGTNARAFNMDCETNAAATDAVLTIGEGVNVSSASDCCVTVFGPCTLNTEGNLTSPNDFAIAGNGTASCAGTVINVTGGTVTGGEVGIYHPQDGVLNISGGTITGATAVYVKSGEINVSGGTLVGTGAAAGYAYNGNGANATGDALVIDNCGYPGGVPAASITGGTFVSENAQSVASYVATDDAGYAGGGSFEKVDGFIAATVDGGANPALFSDAEADGVPEGYALVESETAGLYRIEKLWTVTFIDEDGTELSTADYPYGTEAAAIAQPDEPTKEADAQFTYAFAGWDPEVADVTTNATYKATYSFTTNQYEITFVDEDGSTELKAATAYDYGTAATAIEQPEEPTKAADAQYTYAFAGWDPEVADVTTNATYKATYSFTTNAYEVAFEWHGDSFATNYPYGTAAADVAVPDDPENYTENGTNYAFTGWSPAAVADVTTNATYTAQYGIVPEVDVSCVVTANGDDDEMTLVLAGPDDCDGVADVAIYEWDDTGDEPVVGALVWSTNGVALAEGAAELTVSIDTGVVLPGQLVVAAYLPNDKYSGATASNRVMGTSSIILTTESNYQVDDNIVLGLEAYNSTGDIAVTLWVSDGNGGLTEFDWECAVVENTVEVGELPAGEYVVTAVLAGDANYLGSTDTKSFRVDKLEPGLEAEAGETTEGEPVVVTATLGYDDCTGTVTVAVDGSEYVGDVVDGVAAVIISDLAAGDYEATVTYSGDDKYLEASTNFTIKVAAARPYEEVDGVIWYYEPVGSNAMVTGIAEAHATGNLTMPDTLGGLTVTSVGIAAFHGMTNITGMVLAAGVKDIWRDAFMSCTGLTNVTMGAAVETIDRDAFSDCPGLTDVTIPNGVKVISTNAFNLSGLTNVTFGTGLTSIEQGAFGTCTNLTDVKIPDGVTSIGELAFYDNRSLTNAWLGTGIENVGENAFRNCTSLATIWIPVEQRGTELLDAAGVREGCEIHYYGTQVVKFDANGGTCDVKTNGYTIGEAYGWLPEAEREGYDFTGWWDEAEGVQLATNDTVTEYASRTVSARWALQPGLTVTAGRGGSVLAVIGGRTNVVEGGTTAILRVPRGAAFSVTAVPASGFALGAEGGTGHVEYDSIEEEGVEVSFAFTPNPAGTLYWKYARNANGWFCAQIAFPWHEGYGEALGNLRFLFADRVDAEGNRSAYLVDTSTAFVPLDTVEILETDGADGGLEVRAAAIDTSEFASLRDGAWAIYGVGDATLGTELASVPAGECKIALRVVNRNIGTVEPLHGAIGYLAWDDEDGATHVLPVVPNEGAVAAGNRLLLESALVFGPIEDIPQDGKPVD
ncbi:MAG: leucine-rich repeat protein, partial [Kiritimatiellae bacterium]|nr:leucine-rich repeat protein [Kiritimatiellia bacterium]